MAIRTEEQTTSVMLTAAQRRVAAELMPQLARRFKLDERNQRAIQLSDAEIRALQVAAEAALPTAETGVKRNSLRHIIHKTHDALGRPARGSSSPQTGQVYRFKITLLGFKPRIWRRIEVKDCTFDKLHEYIQTAMGWTNSHLHQFEIEGQRVGDLQILDDGFSNFEGVDSRVTRLSKLLPATARRFRFLYEYDFGDGWAHEVLLEQVAPPEAGRRYPVCLAGKGCCPPEDVGGVWGYAEFLEALSDPQQERHEELLEWCGGSFDPEHFDAAEATRMMKVGLPDWRHF